MKLVIASLVALLLTVSRVDHIYAKTDAHVEKIIVVPDTGTPVIGSLCHQYYSSDAQSSCSAMNFTQFLELKFDAVNEVIFTSGVYIVKINSVEQKHQLVFKIKSHMNFIGKGHVVVKCVSEYNFKFSFNRGLYMDNIIFENCSNTKEEGTLIVEAKDSAGMVSLVNIHVNNLLGKGIEVIFRESDNATHSFSLVNSTINTSSTGVYVGKRNKIINQHFHFSNVRFFSDESCFVLVGNKYTHSTFNISILESQCNLSILSLKSGGSGTNITISELIITKSTSTNIIDLDLTNQSNVTVYGRFQLISNTGTVLHVCHSNLQFNRATVNLHSNLAKIIVLAISSRIVLKNSVLVVRNNRGQQCGGITLQHGSRINFTEEVNVNFTGNYGEQGGAIALYSMSLLVFDHIVSSSRLIFSGNQALKGGAIFMDDNTYIKDHQLETSAVEVHGGCKGCIEFSSNIAMLGGNNIYGGWVDWSIKYNDMVYNSMFSDMIKENAPGIASDPFRVCLCIDGVHNCSITEWPLDRPRELYPGQDITGIQAVAVGQRGGTVVSPVVIRKESDEANYYEVQSVQETCTNLTYTISSPNGEERLLIEVLNGNEFGLSTQTKGKKLNFGVNTLEKYPDKLGILFEQLSIRLKLKNCPKAIPFNQTSFKCACPSYLESLELKCDKVNYAIIRREEQWVGLVYNSTTDHVGLIIAHQHCPNDYCKTSHESLSIRLADNSEICEHNRQGILCGGCEMNSSRVLGSSKCKKCSNLHLLAIIPAFLLSGLLLIIFLMLFNVTVSSGTISGLIFYANVLQAQNATFSLPHASFPSVFIAWLNLDQGLETCLYNGLDSYVESWLQFLFPAYIWLIAGVVIVSSHYSTRISNLCGKNAIPVLATLFLLTYTKLLRLEITVVSYTSITYPNGRPYKTVWLYDGNVDYLKGKHIPLFIATVLLLDLLSVPYTLSLVSIQWLFKISHYRPMFWVNKLKPFFDAYTGPYRARHRYWTGLLLLIRIFLLVSFSLNHSNNPSINILIIGVTSTLLLLWLFFIGGVFESKLNNCLEAFFLCNLIVTSFCTLFELYNKNTSPAVIKVSTGLAFVVFVGIILYHTHKQLLLIKAGTKMKKLFKVVHFKWDSRVETDDNNLQSTSKDVSLNKVSCTVVELAEPLLEDETRN